GEARPVLEVRIVVDDGAQATEDAYFLLVRLQRGKLLCCLVIGADRLGDKELLGKPATPEIGSEPRGYPLAGVGQRQAISIQETVEQRQRHGHGTALEGATKKKPAIECHPVLATCSWPSWCRRLTGERCRNNRGW